MSVILRILPDLSMSKIFIWTGLDGTSRMRKACHSCCCKNTLFPYKCRMDYERSVEQTQEGRMAGIVDDSFTRRVQHGKWRIYVKTFCTFSASSSCDCLCARYFRPECSICGDRLP